MLPDRQKQKTSVVNIQRWGHQDFWQEGGGGGSCKDSKDDNKAGRRQDPRV